MPRKKKVVPQEEPIPKPEPTEEEKYARNELFYYPKMKCEGCGNLKKSNHLLMSAISKKVLCKDCTPKGEKDGTQDSSV